MMVFAWVVLPILCVIALAVFLYFKVSKGIECFFPAWTKKRKRIVSAVLSVVIIAPGFRIYGLWFIILLRYLKCMDEDLPERDHSNSDNRDHHGIWKIQYFSGRQNRIYSADG